MNRRMGRLYSLVVVLSMVALTTYSAPTAAGATSQRAMSRPSASLPPTSRSATPLVVSALPHASAQRGPGSKDERRPAGPAIDLSAGSGGTDLAPVAPATGGSLLSLSSVTRRAAGRQPGVVAPQSITVSSGSSATSCSFFAARGTGTPNHYAAVRVYNGAIGSGTPLIDSFTDETSQGAGTYYAPIGSDGTFNVEASFTAQPAGATISYRIYDAPTNTYNSYDGGSYFDTTVASCTPQAPFQVSSATTYCSLFGAQGTGTPGQYAAVEVYADPSGSNTPLIDSYTQHSGVPTYYTPIGSDGAFHVTVSFSAQSPGTTIHYTAYDAPLNTYGSYSSLSGAYNTTVTCTQDPATPAAQTAAAQTAAAQTAAAQTAAAQTAAAQTAAAQTAAAQTAAARTAAAQTAAAQTAAAQTSAAQTAAAQTAAAQTAAAQTAAAQTAAQTAAAQTAAAQTAAAQTAAAQTAAAQTAAAQTAATRTVAAAPTSVPPTSIPPTSAPTKISTLPTATNTPAGTGGGGATRSPTPTATTGGSGGSGGSTSHPCLRPSGGQVATGGTLTVLVCAAPRAAFTLTLQVLGAPAPARGGKGSGHARPPTVLYSVAASGHANARGRFTARLHVTYRVKGAVPARLTLRTGGHVLTATVRLIPPTLAPLSCRLPAVAIGGNPQAVALAPDGRVYVASGAGVSVVDPCAGRVLRSISLGGVPSALVVDGVGARAYAILNGSEQVHVVDLQRGRPLPSITLHASHARQSPNLIALAFDPRARRVYVADQGNHGLWVLDAARGAVRGLLVIDGLPYAAAVDQANGHLFVASSGGSAGSAVSELDATSGAVLRSIAVGGLPQAVAVDGSTGHVFVAVNASSVNNVSEFDTATGRTLRKVQVGAQTQAVAVDERYRRVFVVTGNGVRVLDAASGQARGTILRGTTPQAVAVDEAHGRVFVVTATGLRSLAVAALP